MQGLKRAHFGLFPECHQLHLVDVAHRLRVEGLGCGFAFQERHVHLAMGEWPDSRPSTGFILFRYLKCFFFPLVEKNLFLL